MGINNIEKKSSSNAVNSIGIQPMKNTDRPKSKNLSALSGLVFFIQPYKLNFLLAFFVLLLTAIIALIFPLAVRRVVDGFNDSSITLMDQYFTAAVAIAGLLAIGTALRFYLITKLGERIIVDIRNAIFDATEQVINEGKYVTFDIGGDATTTQMSEQITTLAKLNLRK